MALSKLAIGLIATIGSVAAVGGITAGVVVSRKNTTQSINSSNDEFKEPKITENKGNKTISSASSNKDERNSDLVDSMVSGDHKAANRENTDNKLDKEEAKKDKEKKHKEKSSAQVPLNPIQSDSDSNALGMKKEEGMGKELTQDKNLKGGQQSSENLKQAEVGNVGDNAGAGDKTVASTPSGATGTQVASADQPPSLQPGVPRTEANIEMPQPK